MADGHFPTLVSKDRLPNSATNTIFVTLTDGTDTLLIDASGNLQAILAANDGTDIGDVTINNGAGASAVNIQDGGNTITVDGTVGISGSVTVTASQLDIDDLNKDDDEVLIWANTVKDGTGTDYVPLVDADGHLQVDILSGGGSNDSVKVDDSAFTVATDSVTAIGAINTADSVDAGDVGALRMLTNRALVVTLEDANGDGIAIDASGNIAAILAPNDGVDIGDVDVASVPAPLNVIGGGTEAAALRVTIANDSTGLLSIDDNGGSLTIDQATHDLLNANANIQVADTDVSTANPVPVTIVDPGVSSTEVHDYDTAATVAGDATDNHDYTASGGTFICRQISLAASGGAKVEVINDATGTPATVWVGFIPKEGGVISHKFEPPVEVANADVLRLTRTNRQGASQDLYSTIEGNQL